MKEVTPLGTRKSDHIRINLQEDVRSGLTSGLKHFHFIHHALPEINLEVVDPSVSLYGKVINIPILISSMTGGTQEAFSINQVLAIAAQETHVAMGVGSQRIALEHPELAYTFNIRQQAPDILLFANIGAIQLNYGYGIEDCQRAVDMIEADALILHFNALQEALQTEGETQFAGLINKVERVCHALSIPVIAKEVGWGFSKQDIALLARAGVSAIDVAGAGGTSWSQVEMYRAENDTQRQLAASFADWGIPTVEAIQNILTTAPDLIIIASGGLRTGVDVAKCLALGATLGGMAGPFLKTAKQSVDATINLINLLKQEIMVCMFATGSKTLDQLRQDKLVYKIT
jgi:isopentenyl-diphosphate delta-isomerase